MQRPIAALPGAVLLIVLMGAAAHAAGTLDMYFIDTEGGQATLLVAPSGDTLLIDVGFAGLDTPNPDKDVGRDAARIADVARAAKVTRIGTLLVTHFHGDHAGGIAHLGLPVGTFVDHGPALQDVPTMKQKAGEYAEDWAAAFARARHVVVQYGRFRFANLGDLPWNQEVALLCPANRVGTIDVYEAAGHGREPTPAVSALEPRVVVLDTDNTRHPAHYLKVSASDDGSFAVFNSRTNETKRYPARR
jgi:beta-lactamase superfamily II metal-dependent hydrolase